MLEFVILARNKQNKNKKEKNVRICKIEKYIRTHWYVYMPSRVRIVITATWSAVCAAGVCSISIVAATE